MKKARAWKEWQSKIDEMGIKAKMIVMFVVIKVVPVVILAGIAWYGIIHLGEMVEKSNLEMVNMTKDRVDQVGQLAVADSVNALDERSREAIEQMTTATALEVSRFLYDCDEDLRTAANLPIDESVYRDFVNHHQRGIFEPGKWILADDGKSWVSVEGNNNEEKNVKTQVKDNEKNWHYRNPEKMGTRKLKPLYLQITFVDLNGNEVIKVNTSDRLTAERLNVADRSNTFCKAEDYFPQLRQLKENEIFVSDVVGEYVGSPIIGPYTPGKAAEKGIPFEPEKAAYAGKENPVGKKFAGLIRWAMPVYKNGALQGYVTLALDHDHILEFTNHIVPTEERYAQLSDANGGNYAFIWDYKGRSIAHPRHHSIVGYDASTGEPAVPWLDTELYAKWKNSGLDIRHFLADIPEFDQPSLKKKPAAELTKAGLVGLDGRYLNFAPQCAGWHELTKYGGSGSFTIFWTGLWKLTTAGAIPYYTGSYGKEKRGFGYVTIGANVDDFHKPANDTAGKIDQFIANFIKDINDKQMDTQKLIVNAVRATAVELTVSTLLMVVLVIAIAVWLATFFTKFFEIVIKGMLAFRGGSLSTRLPMIASDERGELCKNFNEMATTIESSIVELETAKRNAEEANRFKDDFLSNVSHELRTPLNGIIGFAEVMQMELDENNELREYADIIYESGTHLQNLVNDLLDIGKIEAGQINYCYKEEDVRALLHKTVEQQRESIESKGLALSVNVSTNLPERFCCDGRHLGRIFYHILNNAFKFTESGSITVNMDYVDGRLVFAVCDTGKGISEEQQQWIFEKFRQGNDFIKRTEQGAGLGLAIVSKLVTGMNGQICLQSAVGEGTTFYVYLPNQIIGAQ